MPGACSVKSVIKAGTHAEGHVAIDMLAAADEDMGCESIGGLGLNRKMEVRGLPVAASRVADQIAEGGVHRRWVGGRHHAPEGITAMGVAFDAPASPHLLRIEIVLHVVEAAIIRLPNVQDRVRDGLTPACRERGRMRRAAGRKRLPRYRRRSETPARRR